MYEHFMKDLFLSFSLYKNTPSRTHLSLSQLEKDDNQTISRGNDYAMLEPEKSRARLESGCY
jgi:hypothetical protein